MNEDVLKIINKVIEYSKHYNINISPEGEINISVDDDKCAPPVYPNPIDDWWKPTPWNPIIYNPSITSTGTGVCDEYTTISCSSDNKE